jgi:hypothetical protein
MGYFKRGLVLAAEQIWVPLNQFQEMPTYPPLHTY